MNYDILNKVSGNVIDRGITREDLMDSIATFISLNPSRKPLNTEEEMIAYYNRRSYYTAVEVK